MRPQFGDRVLSLKNAACWRCQSVVSAIDRAAPGLWGLGPVTVPPANPQTVPALKLPGLSTGIMRRAPLECLATAIRRGIKVAGTNTGIKRRRKRRRDEFTKASRSCVDESTLAIAPRASSGFGSIEILPWVENIAAGRR